MTILLALGLSCFVSVALVSTVLYLYFMAQDDRPRR